MNRYEWVEVGIAVEIPIDLNCLFYCDVCLKSDIDLIDGRLRRMYNHIDYIEVVCEECKRKFNK